MGAMIMLLVVVAQSVRESANNPVEKEPLNIPALTMQEAEELLEQITMQAEEADWLAERYVLARQESEEALAEQQARLALAERETQKIKEELDRLEQLTRQLDSQTQATPEEVEHLKRLLAQQQQQRAEAELELAELQKEAAKQEKSYAIVPQRAVDGTFRRPIYIECQKDKIIIQPEGVELIPGDFQALDLPDNPFDRVLRTVRQYYMETGQVARDSEPYPLLIIRPSGVEMFGNALDACSSAPGATRNWITDFGYEIVNEDWNIQYPEPNDDMRNRMIQQLEDSRNRLSSYLVASQMYAGRYGGDMPQYRVNPQGRVVPVDERIRNGEDLQRLFAANRQGAGQQTGELESEGHAPPRFAAPQGAVADNTSEVNAQRAAEKDAHLAGTPATQGTGEPQAPMMRPMQNQAQRPQNWGLKGATQYTTGISRPVIIRCEANRFVLAAQAGLRTERVIPITGSVSSAADQLVQTIWEFQESWDSAGENAYWRPRLQVRVSPGGEQRLEELKAHLKTSGLVFEE